MAIRTEAGAKKLNSLYSELNMYFLARNLTDKKVSLFVMPIVSKSPVTDLVTSNYNPYMTGANYIKDSTGQTIDNLKSNTEDPSATFTLEHLADLKGYQTATPFGGVKNMFEIASLGGVFKVGADLYEVVGMNGLVLKNGAKPTKCEIGNDWKYLTYSMWSRIKDGMAFDDNGKPVYKSNLYVNKPNAEVKSVALELYTLYDDSTSPTKFVPYAYTGKVMDNENETANTMSAEFTYASDIYESNESLLYGVPETSAIDAVGKQFLAVDYIIEATSNPTDFGVSGDTIALVDPTTGAVTLATSTGSAWTAETTGTFITGGIIVANKVSASTLALATDVRTFVAVKTPNGTNGGTCANFAYDTTGATKNFLCKTNILGEDGTFAPFAPVGTDC